jgi:hypothetical protein
MAITARDFVRDIIEVELSIVKNFGKNDSP